MKGPSRSTRSICTMSMITILATGMTATSLHAQPLPTDEKLVQGTLPNGMAYIVRRHGNPPGRANMWLHVSTGSLNETDAQRGLAHYLEHMAFNGTENFPPGTVIKFFEEMGLNFGQHQNAFTSFDQTTYQLSFPDTDAKTLDKGLTFFADVAGRMLLLPEEIEEERQIILEEKRARSSARQRVQEYILERIAPGSTIGVRLPIGVEETLLSMGENEFREYYSRWYVPSNMTLMVVADEDPAKIVERIRQNFEFGENVPRPVDRDANVSPTRGRSAIIATDPELTQASVSILRVDRARPAVTTYEAMRANLVESLGERAFNRRMGAKLNRGGTAYLSASASISDYFSTLRQVSVEANGKPEDWPKLLAELGEDLQRARLHGFTAREIEDVKTQLISSAERFVEQESTLPARVVLQQMNANVAVGEPLMSATQQLEALRRLLPTIGAEEVSSAFKSNFDIDNVIFVAELPSVGVDVPDDSRLTRLGAEALAVTPAAEVEEARPDSLMASAPESGKVLERSTHQPSEVTTLVLGNGVTVRHRFMDIRKDQVGVTITLAAGTINEGQHERGVAEVAGLAWSRPATGSLSSTNIRDLMTGKKVSVGGSAGIDAMTLSVSGSPADLETGMQLAHLLLTDPRIEGAALEQWREGQLQAIEARRTDPQAAFFEMMTKATYPTSDARTQMLTADQVRRITMEAAQAWLKGAVRSAPIEVSIVGDISLSDAERLALAYLGSLPARERMSGSTLDDLRALERPRGPVTQDATLATKTDKAMVCVGFFGPDPEDLENFRTMRMASQIMRSRMTQRVREKEQLAYSPSAGVRASQAWPGFSAMMALLPTDPGKVARVLEVVPEMYGEFATDGPTAEEVETAKRQLANDWDERTKQPQYWSGLCAQLNYRNLTLDEALAENEFYQSLTPERVREVFARYYKPENSFAFSLKPEAGAAGGDMPAAN